MTRQRKPIGLRRSVVYSTRFTFLEANEIEWLAEERGISPSSLIEQLATNAVMNIKQAREQGNLTTGMISGSE